MFNIGDHVYHKGVQANGIITEIDDENYKRDIYKVNFFWGKYCDIKYGRWIEKPAKGTKWQRCSENQLIGFPKYVERNKVTSIGGRSLDRLIRRVCDIGRRRPRDGSDAVICYGQSHHRVPPRVFMLNRNLTMNKYHQVQILGDLAPESTRQRTFDGPGWIIKPFISIGGRGIRHANNDYAGHHEYYQREFYKVREFRVHCFLWAKEPVSFIQEKVIEDPDQLCWNKKQGGAFQYPYQPDLNYGKYNGNLSMANVQIMTKMSIEALKKLRMDFGGLDFGMDAQGKFKIFEVNSRMGLRERSFYTYKKMFNELKELDINTYRQNRWAV